VLIHSVAPYSNWEWGRIAQSESLAALHLGLQSTLVKLGHVPEFHQTDNSSAETVRLSALRLNAQRKPHGEAYWPGAKARAQTGQRREYTDGYLQLLAHYGLEPRTTNINSPQENGDVESSHGGLKRAIEQYLLLRGSRDFDGIELYEGFLFDVMERRNRPRQARLPRRRQARLAEELAVMKPLSATSLATSSQVRGPVTRGSRIRVQKNSYSVPTSLIGHQVTVRIHARCEYSRQAAGDGSVVPSRRTESLHTALCRRSRDSRARAGIAQ